MPEYQQHRHSHIHRLDPGQLAAILAAVNAAIPPQPAVPVESDHLEPVPALIPSGSALFLDPDSRVRHVHPDNVDDAPATWRRLYTR